MHKHFKRLGLAFAISLTSLLGTLTWYYAGQKSHHAGASRDAVARLTESTDEVQRKETDRVIWETISLNDDLFTGEAIRTSAKASAQVRLKTGAVIHLDPDSLVVLEQNANGLALDFLEGNLFIQGAANGAASGITLKTGQGEIKMSSADVSLSRAQGGNVDLEVYRGELELNQGGKTVALGRDKAATLSQTGLAERRDRLKLTSPAAGDVILLNLAKGERLDLAWTALPAGYRVFVEAGATRGGLASVGKDAFDGAGGRAAIDLKPGRWFVRLSARAEGQPELTSLITPFTLAPRTAPALIEPVADLTKTTADQKIKFQWLDRNPFEAHVIEVATDDAFKTVVARDNLGGDVDQWTRVLPDGTYFWRVTGFSNKKGSSSAAIKFRVALATDDRAALTAPADHARVAAADAASKGVTFKWQSTATKDLAIEVRDAAGKVAYHAESGNGFARALDLKPGAYTWTVTGAKVSDTFAFTIVETPRLTFVNPQPGYEYTTPSPSVAAEWIPVEKATYRYRLGPVTEALAEASWTPVKQTKFRVAVPADGPIKLVVEALGPKGDVIAASEERVIQVKRKPLLASPKWADGDVKSKSDGRGNVTLDWTPVDGAKGYVLDLEDETGRTVSQKFDRAPASLKRMRPGQYQIKVRGVDEFDRGGEIGPSRALDVPNASDIRAPKIKAMKVK